MRVYRPQPSVKDFGIIWSGFKGGTVKTTAKTKDGKDVYLKSVAHSNYWGNCIAFCLGATDPEKTYGTVKGPLVVTDMFGDVFSYFDSTAEGSPFKRISGPISPSNRKVGDIIIFVGSNKGVEHACIVDSAPEKKNEPPGCWHNWPGK